MAAVTEKTKFAVLVQHATKQLKTVTNAEGATFFATTGIEHCTIPFRATLVMFRFEIGEKEANLLAAGCGDAGLERIDKAVHRVAIYLRSLKIMDDVANVVVALRKLHKRKAYYTKDDERIYVMFVQVSAECNEQI